MIVIFSQNTNLSEVIGLLNSSTSENSHLVITSHMLFDFEKDAIKKNTNREIDFKCFGDFTDTAFSICDEQAYINSKRWLNFLSIYQRKYIDSLIFWKNKLIHEKIQKMNGDLNYHVFCNPYDQFNLGISYSYWSNEAQIHPTSDRRSKTFYTIKKISENAIFFLPAYFSNAIKSVLIPRKMYMLVRDKKKYEILLSKKRVSKQITEISKTIYSLILLEFLKGRTFISPLHQCATLLNISPLIDRRRYKIIQDAYRPTDYTPYYFVRSYHSVAYIPKYYFDKELFANEGFHCLPVMNYQDNGLLRVDSPQLRDRFTNLTVVFSLNHAGDWTALISRSDTDILIQHASDLAKLFPNIKFVIRLHPTMNDERGEGPVSKTRVSNFLSGLDLENIEVSDLSLLEDIERGDLFMTEYSLSVLQALEKGKPAVFLNFTNRVNFVSELQDCGFPVFSKPDESINLLRNPVQIDILLENSIKAIEVFNYKQKEMLMAKDTFSGGIPS